jgi:hypothetical protein
VVGGGIARGRRSLLGLHPRVLGRDALGLERLDRRGPRGIRRGGRGRDPRIAIGLLDLRRQQAAEDQIARAARIVGVLPLQANRLARVEGAVDGDHIRRRRRRSGGGDRHRGSRKPGEEEASRADQDHEAASRMHELQRGIAASTAVVILR